jgi:hypothetical protein
MRHNGTRPSAILPQPKIIFLIFPSGRVVMIVHLTGVTLMTSPNPTPDSNVNSGRRDFLASCGKFAITVPPAMTVLLSTSLSSPAIAKSDRHERKTRRKKPKKGI